MYLTDIFNCFCLFLFYIYIYFTVRINLDIYFTKLNADTNYMFHFVSSLIKLLIRLNTRLIIHFKKTTMNVGKISEIVVVEESNVFFQNTLGM